MESRARARSRSSCSARRLVLALAGQAGAATVTGSGDDLRTGWYPDQSSLTPQLVSGGTFGQLWSAAVDGQVYAQPLLAQRHAARRDREQQGLRAQPGDRRGEVDRARTSARRGTPADIGCGDLTPNIGVTATPVIDPATNTAYLTHKTYASGTLRPGALVHGRDRPRDRRREAPASRSRLSGSGAERAGADVLRRPPQLQRPGLLLMDGVVYAAFGSHCDITPWQGWVFGVSTGGDSQGALGRRTDAATAPASGSPAPASPPTARARSCFSTGNGGAPDSPAAARRRRRTSASRSCG